MLGKYGKASVPTIIPDPINSFIEGHTGPMYTSLLYVQTFPSGAGDCLALGESLLPLVQEGKKLLRLTVKLREQFRMIGTATISSRRKNNMMTS